MSERAVALTHGRDHQLLAQVLGERRLRVVRAAPVVLVALNRRAGGRFLRHHDVVDSRCVAQRRRGRFGVFLEKWICRQRLVHLLRELERGHLEELERLLHLRGKGEMLPQP